MTRITALLLLLAWVMPEVARADDAQSDVLHQVGIDQRLNESIPLELPFRDEAGHDVRLKDYFDGRPVVMVLAYYRCPMLCTEVLNGLTKSLKAIPFEMDRQYRVITVSFDAREQPELAAAKKATYVASYGRPGAAT